MMSIHLEIEFNHDVEAPVRLVLKTMGCNGHDRMDLKVPPPPSAKHLG